MNIIIKILIEKNRKKLTKMIENNQPYNKILKQSQILDKYILLGFKELNKKERT